MNNSLVNSLVWKLLERFGVQGISFIIQIILARILSPDDYGVLSVMIIFTTLANVFIQTGFNTALIQNKDVTEEDYSSVFWISIIMAFLIYVLLFVIAPIIADFYDMPTIVKPFRVLSLVLFPGSLNSIQLAKVSKELDFKQVFRSNIGAILVSGLLGIILAYLGWGVWALVLQYLSNVIIACIVMHFTVGWTPKLAYNFKRVKSLLSFGWKILLSSLIDALYQDLSSLVIGKKYSSSMLGFYNRGKQFPQFFIGAINGAVQSVMLPAMARKQDDRRHVKTLMRKSIMLSSFIIFPIMAGLAGIADSLVALLLTEKWLISVPFLQIFCFSLAFYPVHSCNLQAINAMGRSDIFLKLEIIKKVLGIILLMISILFFSSPIAIAFTGVITSVIGCFINAYPNKILIDYSYYEQFKDIIPSLGLSLIMFFCILPLKLLNLPIAIILLSQIAAGILVYFILSILFRVRAFKIIKIFVKNVL